DDAPEPGVTGVVHVDHGAEELEELGRHVEDARRSLARAIVLGVTAGLHDVGMAGDRPVARAVQRYGDRHTGRRLRVLEVGDRPDGKRAAPASRKWAMANGMPMIVMAQTTPEITCDRASHQPKRMNQSTLPTAEGISPGIVTMAEPKGHSVKPASLKAWTPN